MSVATEQTERVPIPTFGGSANVTMAAAHTVTRTWGREGAVRITLRQDAMTDGRLVWVDAVLEGTAAELVALLGPVVDELRTRVAA